MSKKVAIIGAGVTGMATTKACLEQSGQLVVTVFERSKHIAGLWRFRHEVHPGTGSVMHSTIVNSSKEMTAFSDFPVPERYPNFMHNRFMNQYLLDYGKSFDFERYVLFQHEVVHVERINDEDNNNVEDNHSQISGQYRLVVKNLINQQVQMFNFDAVAICTGHNHTPRYPPLFPGQAQFGGKVLHSHGFRCADEFRDKVVVVVGVGNSAGDVAAELAPIARQVYLSSRRGGTWLIRRTGLNGYPMDTWMQRRLVENTLALVPFRLKCFVVENFLNKIIGHELIGLKPNNTRFFSQHIMVNDLLPVAIHLGQIIVKYNISSFTSNGVIFEGEDEETECDAVIFGTGYQLSYPFLPSGTVDWNQNGQIKLYKHVFDPQQPKPETLAFIGLTQPIGSLPPIAEIQARWFALLLTGQCDQLPPPERMYAEIERRRRNIGKRYGIHNQNRFTFQADWLAYMDSVAKSANIKPNLLKYFFTDFKLWWSLLTKPAIPAQFRLQGPNCNYEEARKLILTIKTRIKGPYQTKVDSIKVKQDYSCDDSLLN